MNSMKRLDLTGYVIEYVDLREQKPRQHYTETAVLDAEIISAMRLVGTDVTEYIRKRYEKRGYHVLTISKAERRESYIDLSELYRQVKA